MEYARAHALNSAIRNLCLRHRARAAVVLSPLDLHPGQEFVLMELAANGPQIQTKLAEAVGCERPSITLMVRKLEAVGYVARRPSDTDRRASVVTLTDKGRAVMGRLEKVWCDLADETVAGFAEPVEEVVDVLTRLADNVTRPAARA